MKPGSWQRARELFEQLLDLPESQRAARAEAACQGDDELLELIAGMLAADRRADHLLDRPILGHGALEDTETIGAAVTPPALVAGTVVGRYRILRLLAEGGMGAVYLAVRDDGSFTRRVVIKLVRSGMESSQILRRLDTERRILAALDHPYISRLYDGGSTDDGRPYFVLEYIEGQPIDTYCRTHALSIDERLVLFAKVCDAVQFAHQNLVVHRDLKPANILVTEEGDPKLLDFGIAKLLNPAMAGDAGEPTDVLMRIATPSYASPEQLRGDLVSTASDVYSLGVLLYLLLADDLPHRFAGLSLAEILDNLSSSTPVPPSVALASAARTASAPGAAADDSEPPPPPFSEVERDLDAIVMKALRTVPRQRYGSPEQMAADIDRYRRGLPVHAHAGDWRYRFGKWMRRHRTGVGIAAMIALMVLGFTVAFAAQARRVAVERDLAMLERDKKTQVLSLMLEVFQLGNPHVAPGEELTVRQALDRSVGVLSSSLADQPEVHAELLTHAGVLLNGLGSPDDARDLLEQAVELRRAVGAPETPELADSLSALAGSYKDLGELERAEALARRAVDMAREAAAEAGPADAAARLAGPINELVSVLCYQREYAAAEPAAREALELAQSLGSGGQHAIVAYEHLARIRDAAGDYEGSVRLSRQAIALRRERYGEQHPGQLGTLNNLGTSLRRMGSLEAAEQTYDRAVALYRHNFGDRDTSQVLPALLNNSAAVAFARGHFERAIELYAEADRVVVATAGPEYWMSFHFRVRKARAEIAAGQAEAIDAVRRLIDAWSPRLGSDHWRIAEARGVLGDGLSRHNRCSEAEPLLIDSFDRLVETPNHNVRSEAFDRLRSHFERCGDASAIEPYAHRLAEAG